MSHPSIDPFSDELLAELLLSAHILTEEKLLELRALQASESASGGILHKYAFGTDPLASGLVVIDPQTQEIAERVPLSDELPPPDLIDWPSFSSGDLLILSPTECDLLGAVSIAHAPTSGLIPTPQGSYLYRGEIPKNEGSPRLSSLLAPTQAPTASRTHPLDMAASTGGEFLLVANRGGGTVHVVVVNTCQQAGAIMLRAAGSRRAIGMAVDRKVAYLADGGTPRLTVLDLLTLKVKHQPFPTGPLGTLALTPDGSHLLIVFYKAGDELGLLTVSTADMRVRHLMNLPAFKLVDGPGETIIVSPDGNLAYLLAADEHGKPRLFGIDLPRKKVAAEIPLVNMPLGLAFPAPQEWLPPRQTLEQIVLRMGITTPEELQSLQEPEPAVEVGVLMDPSINPLILSQLPERLVRSMGMVPMMRDATHLTVAMVNPRDAACQQLALQLAGGLNLRIIPIEPEELEQFLTDRYPTLMASYQAMKNATPASRGPAPTPGPQPGGPQPGSPQPGPQPGAPKPGPQASVQSAAAAKPAPTDPPPPKASPMPASPMPTKATEPPPPPAALRGPMVSRPAGKGEATLASIETMLSGNGRRFLLAENLKRQLSEIERDRADGWVFKNIVAGTPCYLPSGRILATDLGSHRVVEIDPLSAQIVWTFGDPSERAKSLRSPRYASRLGTGHTLISDTGNHRLVEVDAQGQMVWSHGEQGRAGCSGIALFKPHAALRTAEGTTLIADTGNHRVIEVNAEGEILWQYGNATNRLGGNQGNGSNQLMEPVWAVRLAEGHTLIADTGNARVLELDHEKNLVWQYRAHTTKGGTAVKDPMAATRLPGGNTVILGRQGAIEVDVEGNITWEHHLVVRESGTSPLVPASFMAATTPFPQQAMPEVSHVVPAAKPPEPEGIGSELPPNLPDTFLLPDRQGGRVLEIDRKMQITWQFSGLVLGKGSRLVAPNYVVRLANEGTLIADTGNHRVFEIREQSIIWQFGKAGDPGSGPRQLSQPRSAERTFQGTMLMADFGNHRVLETTIGGETRWTHEGLKGPCYASRLLTGNTLICDWADHQVLEVDPRGKVVWSYGQSGYGGSRENQLYHPEHAIRLENGNTLICDTQNHRVLEVGQERQIVWQYGGDPGLLGRKGRFGIQLNTPVLAWRLPEGNTVVVHAGKNHIVELDPNLNILWHFTLSQ